MGGLGGNTAIQSAATLANELKDAIIDEEPPSEARLGLALGYLPVRSDLNALTAHVNQIDSYLAAQQQPAPAPASGTPQPGKKHGQR